MLQYFTNALSTETVLSTAIKSSKSFMLVNKSRVCIMLQAYM